MKIISKHNSRIHSTAIVHPSANIGSNVEIGPYSIVENNVTIGDHCKIGSNVFIGQNTTLGNHNEIYHGAVLGQVPLDLKYFGETSYLTIGNNNTIREYATISLGTAKGGLYTKVDDHNLIMSYVHIGHDCHIGSHTIISNGSQLAGHVTVDNYTVIGGMVGIHQFSRIGSNCMLGSNTKIGKDVIPFVLIDGNPAHILGLNLVGLRRRGFRSSQIKMIRHAYSTLFDSKVTIYEALAELEKHKSTKEIENIISFVRSSTRGMYKLEDDYV